MAAATGEVGERSMGEASMGLEAGATEAMALSAACSSAAAAYDSSPSWLPTASVPASDASSSPVDQ